MDWIVGRKDAVEASTQRCVLATEYVAMRASASVIFYSQVLPAMNTIALLCRH